MCPPKTKTGFEIRQKPSYLALILRTTLKSLIKKRNETHFKSLDLSKMLFYYCDKLVYYRKEKTEGRHS